HTAQVCRYPAQRHALPASGVHVLLSRYTTAIRGDTATVQLFWDPAERPARSEPAGDHAEHRGVLRVWLLAGQPPGRRVVAASIPVAGHACGPASLGVGTLGAVDAFGELINLEDALGGHHVEDVHLVGVFGPVDAAAHEDAEPTVDGELCEFCPLGSSSGG